METSSNNIVIGSVALVIILMAFGFVIWIGQIQLSREFTTYDMYFQGSVSGLNVASEVRYNGIKVGDVKDIDLDENDPNLVRVRVEVAAATPVKEDTVASMSFLGVTGVSFIELTGGSTTSPPLLPQKGEPYGVIEVQRSAIQELVETAPNIVAQSNMLLLQGAKLLSDENVERLTETLANLNTIVGAIAERDEEISALIASASATARELEGLTREMNAFTASTNDMMAEDIPEMIKEIRSAAASIDKFAGEAGTLVADNRASIDQFSNQGLSELNALLAEARVTVATLERLAAEIEDDPTVLLGQNSYPEYEAN